MSTADRPPASRSPASSACWRYSLYWQQFGEAFVRYSAEEEKFRRHVAAAASRARRLPFVCKEKPQSEETCREEEEEALLSATNN